MSSFKTFFSVSLIRRFSDEWFSACGTFKWAATLPTHMIHQMVSVLVRSTAFTVKSFLCSLLDYVWSSSQESELLYLWFVQIEFGSDVFVNFIITYAWNFFFNKKLCISFYSLNFLVKTSLINNHNNLITINRNKQINR